MTHVDPSQLANKVVTSNGVEEPDEDLKMLVENIRNKYGNVFIVDARYANNYQFTGMVNYNSNSHPVAPEGVGFVFSGSQVPDAAYIIEPQPPDPEIEKRSVIDANKTGVVYGDPAFVGFEGSREFFYVSGEANKDYNLLSDRDVQVNGKFVPSGAPITYLGDVGVKVRHHKIQYTIDGSPPSINGRSLAPGSIVKLNKEENVSWDGKILVIVTKEYTMKISKHRLEVISGKDGVYKLDGVMPHGLLGQTADEDHNVRVGHDYQGSGAIEGSYRDYEVSDLFSTNFKFNKYRYGEKQEKAV